MYNFPWMSTDGKGTKWQRNITENFNRLSTVHERHRQTDDKRTGDSIANVSSSRSLKISVHGAIIFVIP